MAMLRRGAAAALAIVAVGVVVALKQGGGGEEPVGVAGTLLYAYSRIQIPAAPPAAQTTYVYDRHGHVIGTLHATVNRTDVPFSDMPVIP